MQRIDPQNSVPWRPGIALSRVQERIIKEIAKKTEQKPTQVLRKIIEDYCEGFNKTA